MLDFHSDLDDLDAILSFLDWNFTNSIPIAPIQARCGHCETWWSRVYKDPKTTPRCICLSNQTQPDDYRTQQHGIDVFYDLLN